MFLSPTYYEAFYHLLVAMCICVIDIDFFVSFHVGSSDGKFISKVIISNIVRQYTAYLES